MSETTTLMFQPGAIVCTPGALRALREAQTNAVDVVKLHTSSEEGFCCTEDRDSTRGAADMGLVMRSTFTLPTQVRLSVVTEADRSMTTLLLPNEY